jgi:hypothetical protein
MKKNIYLNTYVIHSIPFSVFLQEYEGATSKSNWYRMERKSLNNYEPIPITKKPNLEDLRSWKVKSKHTLQEAVAYFNRGGWFREAENPTSKTFRVSFCRSGGGKDLIQYQELDDDQSYWYLTDLDGESIDRYYIDGGGHNEWTIERILGDFKLPWGEGFCDIEYDKIKKNILNLAREALIATSARLDANRENV